MPFRISFWVDQHNSWAWKVQERSHKICQALGKESEKAPGREKKMAPLYFRAMS